MRRTIAIVGCSAVFPALLIVCYLKGHADGVNRSTTSSMYKGSIILNGLEAGEIERAKSNQALFISGELESLESKKSWLATWLEWARVDSDYLFGESYPTAVKAATTYQDTFVTQEAVTEAIREAVGNPEFKVEHKIK